MANENERAAAARLVEGLLAAGFELNIDNGSDRPLLSQGTKERDQVLEVMFEASEEEIVAVLGDYVGVVRIAYGRAADGSELVFDHSEDLGEIVAAAVGAKPVAVPRGRGRRRGPKP